MMRTEAEMKCDVCGCVTSHLTIAKPPERPKDECQKCYWTRELNIEGIKAECYAAVAEAAAMKPVIEAAQAVEWRGCVTDDSEGIIFVVPEEVWQPMCDALKVFRAVKGGE